MTPNPTGREGLVERLNALADSVLLNGASNVYHRKHSKRGLMLLEAAARISQLEARVAELEREREEQGSSNASRAATGPAARIASVVEPSADLEALHIKAFIEQGRKQQAARLAGQPFRDWLRALAKIADPDDPAGWLVGCVVLNEDCWFDYFADGCTPASCWAEQCSYD